MSPGTPGDLRLPEPLLRYVELFQRHQFWESHEVLEGPWRKEGSRFYHGLILLASAFVHVQRDNTHGIGAQLRKTEDALAPFAPHYLGVDVDEILAQARALRAQVERGRSRTGERAPWGSRVRLPTLTLDLSKIRGDEPELRS